MPQTNAQLRQENAHLQARLAEAEETLRAIRNGEVDALVVSTTQGDQIFTLQGADQPYRLMIEEMEQGAVTISGDGIILYCNRRFAMIVDYALDHLISQPIEQYIVPGEREVFKSFLRTTSPESGTYQAFHLQNQSQRVVPVYIAPIFLLLNRSQVICLVVTDLTERQRIEQELARLAAIVTGSNDAIMSVTLDGIITSWNRGAERIFGYSADEIIHQPLKNLIPPEKRGEETLIIEKVAAGELVENYDTIRLKKDGNTIFVSVSVSPIVDGHGMIMAVSRIIHDITRRKQIEHELEQIRQQLRLITDSLPVLISYIGQDRRYQFANIQYKSWFGLEQDQIVGKHIVEVVGQAAFETAKSYFDAAFKGETVEYEREVPYTNGARFTHTQMIPHRLEDGLVAGIIVMVQDITERKKNVAALQQSEARLRSVITATSEGIILHAADGTIQSCNTAAEHILGLTADQMMGLTSVDPRWRAVHEDGLPFPGETHPAMVTLRTGKPLSNVVMGVYKPDDTLTWILINAQPIFDINTQNVSAVVVSFTDITERKKTEQQTIELGLERQRTKLLADFARDTSHDLRTPITIILNGLYLIRRIQDEARRSEKIQVVEHHVLYLNRVLEQFQQMAILDSMTELSLQTGDLNSLIRDAVSVVMKQVDEKKITISTSFEDDMSVVLCDSDRLDRALVELLRNAIRFTPPGGQIQVRSRVPNPHQLVLEVEDNGMGIPPDKQPRIFERFYKVDEARSITGGAGLGLPMVKRVIELHHGSLEVESIPGEKTLFRIVLPVVAPDAKNTGK